MNKRTLVIGGGVAGLTAASHLASLGVSVTLIEKEDHTGGHAAGWSHLFPTRRPAGEVISFLERGNSGKTEIITGKTVTSIGRNNGGFTASLSDLSTLQGDAVILATGFDLFDAARKEEYGYGIYENVITSAELESVFRSGEPVRTRNGKPPRKVAFIHCVGSRDEKVGNLYCSKVCCVTGVKQAIEIREKMPATEVFSFYMDLRMFDRFFEELYFEAQQKWGVSFIRGRLSECAENPDHSIVIKTEDTLTGRPLKMTVDLVVLLVGFTPRACNRWLGTLPYLTKGVDGFITANDGHIDNNGSAVPGIYLAGTIKGPGGIAETIADARATALQVYEYLSKQT